MNGQRSTYQDVSYLFPKPGAALPTTPAIDTRLLLEKAHRPAQQDQIRTLVLSAWIIGGSITLVAVIVSGVIIYLAHERAPFVWLLLPLSILAGVITAAVLTIQWTHRAALRSWQLEDEDRFYRLRDVEDLYDMRRSLPGAPAARDVVRLELVQPLDGQAKQTQLIDLPATAEQLEKLARGLLAGASLSEAQWSGGNNGIFTRSQFSQLRAELIKRKLAAWNNSRTPARGAALTPAGRAIMRRFAGETVRPPSQDD
jgi:hypothetical protein